MDAKRSTFNGKEIEMKKMTIRKANDIFPLVATSMTKLSLGDYNCFSHLKPSDFEAFQEKMCEHILMTSESKLEDGNVISKKKNLTISDLNESVEEFLPLLYEFLEFNFRFFSFARRLLDPILTKISESVEK